MSVVVAKIHVEAPVRDVWDLAMDPHRTEEWVTISRGVLEAEGSPDEVGFRMKQRLCLRGVPFTVEWELTEVDAPYFAHYEGRGPMRSKAIIENRLSEAPEGGTHYDYRNEFKAPFGPLGATAQRVLAGGIPEREAVGSLQRLKQILEQQPARREAAAHSR
jgi:uncharacterized protein YndB with AHSA1/START domain